MSIDAKLLELERRFYLKTTLAALITLLCIAILLLCWGFANASEFTDEQIVDAIYLAEGGARAKVLYGILSVKVANKAEARRVCFNTVRNNRKRFANQTKYTDYLEFLASRYCPIGAKNDPTGLNRNWLKNVRYFLARAR